MARNPGARPARLGRVRPRLRLRLRAGDAVLEQLRGCGGRQRRERERDRVVPRQSRGSRPSSGMRWRRRSTSTRRASISRMRSRSSRISPPSCSSLGATSCFASCAPAGCCSVTTHGRSYVPRLDPDERARFERGELVVRWSDVPGTNLCSAYHPEVYLHDTFAQGLHVPRARARRRARQPDAGPRAAAQGVTA